MTLQHDWIKTQVRLPNELHLQAKQYAKDNDLSMNSAILELIKNGLSTQSIKNAPIEPNSTSIRVEKHSIIEYDDFAEPALSIDLKNAVLGLVESQYKDIKIMAFFNSNSWMLSYYGVKCSISKEAGKFLIEKGCTLVP